MWFPYKITSSCIWVAIPVDWYACDADGRTVTWLPKFLGWVDYHIFLGKGLRSRARGSPLWFYLRETISGPYFKQNIRVFKPAPFSMSKFVAGHLTKTWFLKFWITMNTNFALKLQVNCWKAKVVTFTGHLSVTIERLTRYKQNSSFDHHVGGQE